VKTKLTSADIEYEVARWFGWRQNLIVPNVSWGLGLHECDLLVCSKAGYCTEVEIKISKADLVKDKEKSHGHKSKKIKYLYFAMPEELDRPDVLEHVPGHAGILVVRETSYSYHVKKLRDPLKNIDCRALTEREQYEMARLGALRIWDLKHTIVGNKNTIKHLREQIKEIGAKP
jgi:hypothetical protein